ncbi:hypothetical protein ACLB1Q_13185 [Escherichia coli]
MAVTQGEAWLDEAMLTGEPIPQQKGEGDSVHAGQWCRTVACCCAPVRLVAIPRYQGLFAWCARPRAASQKSVSSQ